MVDKLSDYFNNHNTELEIQTTEEMDYLLKILPTTLKTQLAKFLYQDAILTNKLLQFRDDHFYSKYLEELKTERFNQGDPVTKAGQIAEAMIIIVSGVAYNKTAGKFLETGSLINLEPLYFKQPISLDIVADTSVIVLKYSAAVFAQIMDEFPDFNEDVKKIVEDNIERSKIS